MIELYEHDKSTVFSIVPFDVREFRPGLFPGSFNIKPCKDANKPERLVVGASEHIMEVGDKRPIRIITPSFEVARSIVDDFLDGQLWTSSDVKPGICYVQGTVSVKEFLEKHAEKHAEMKEQQKHWFVNVCKKTDDDWVKYHHHRVVSDQARFAARYLGLEPEWLRAETIGLSFKKCPACSTVNDPNNAVCVSCRCVLDEAKYKSLKFATA